MVIEALYLIVHQFNFVLMKKIRLTKQEPQNQHESAIIFDYYFQC